MDIKNFVEILGVEYFTGVPDSQLKVLCNFLMNNYGIDSRRHIICANESNCAAMAAGYHLATGKIPAVYLQNSGEGNIVNPVLSLLSPKVYGIPVIFIIGWRGEPNIHDEPQHIHQGAVTLNLLDDIGISHFVVRKDTAVDEIATAMKNFRTHLSAGEQVAFVVAKDAFTYDAKVEYRNDNELLREAAIKNIVDCAANDVIVATTGKTGRELFELRESLKQSHQQDFLTVGAMGNASSIALGIATQQENRRVWCIDGDGAVLMHMGAMAVIGSIKPNNFVHVVINNSAHESVGGMPTVAGDIDLLKIAEACGYQFVASVDSVDDLTAALNVIKNLRRLCFLEIKCAIGSRKNLGRPTIPPIMNKNNLMRFLSENLNSASG